MNEQISLYQLLEAMKQDEYTVKSLFSGAGGLECGLDMAGLHVIESYEYEKKACDTLANVGKTNVYKCDISTLLLENQLKTYVIATTFLATDIIKHYFYKCYRSIA